MLRSLPSFRDVALAAVIIAVAGCGATVIGTSYPPTSQPQPSPAPTSTPRSDGTFTPAPIVNSDQAAAVFIRLADPLDEPEYYCLDVPGAGAGVRLGNPLQAHTCKLRTEAADELFAMDRPSDAQIYMPAYDLCLAASESGAGAVLWLEPCADSPLQRFVYTAEGQISPQGQDQLCLVIDPAPGIPTGGPSHLRRDVYLENCEEIDPSLTRWLLDENVLTPGNR